MLNGETSYLDESLLAFGLVPPDPSQITADQRFVHWLMLASALGDLQHTARRTFITPIRGIVQDTNAAKEAFSLAQRIGALVRRIAEGEECAPSPH